MAETDHSGTPTSQVDRAAGTQASSTDGPSILVEDLLKKCHGLLDELEQFRTFLTERKQNPKVEIRQFTNSILSELKSLEKLSSADPAAERTIHTLRSSNLPFYSAVWDAAKASTGLVTFNKRFYWGTSQPRNSKRAGKPPKKRCALVDIVAQGGEEWVKVSTVTESRLLFELAKAGWEGADSSSEDSDRDNEKDGLIINATNGFRQQDSKGITFFDSEDSSDNSDDGKLELVRLVMDLKKASRAVRIRYKHPQIRIVLPKIIEGRNPQIDTILSSLRATGAIVQCGSLLRTQQPPFATLLPLLIPSLHSSLTQTLNIDCTILLAVVSDLSHLAHIPEEPWFHAAIRRQIDLESEEQLLPTYLWPVMVGRELVCTEEAAARMREIVALIGTRAERERMGLLLGDDVSLSPTQFREAFQAESDYTVPADWKLPIRIVHADVDGILHDGSLPSVAADVARQLTAINKSVFLYGWRKGWTTVSSNRTVVRIIEGVVETQGEGAVGPEVWLCGTARSLVGKENRRGG